MVQRHPHRPPCGFGNLATRREHFCCVHVRVRPMSAALAQEEGSLPVPCLGVPASGALTRRAHRVHLPHPAPSLFRFDADPEGKPPEGGILQAPVQTLLLLHVPARLLHSPPGRACHVRKPEALQGDHPVAGDDLDRRVPGPVLALVVGLPVRLRYLAVELLPLGRELRVCLALALQGSDLLPRDLQEPRHHEQGPIRESSCHRDSPVEPPDLLRGIEPFRGDLPETDVGPPSAAWRFAEDKCPGFASTSNEAPQLANGRPGQLHLAYALDVERRAVPIQPAKRP